MYSQYGLTINDLGSSGAKSFTFRVTSGICKRKAAEAIKQSLKLDP
jgi:hypothetical protein